MIHEQALIPRYLSHRGNLVVENLLSIFLGVSALCLLAQIAIPLPWTPVPITGQTFGVAITALLFGCKRGVAIVITYLFLGAVGLPVFALAKSGISFGPTMGYLLGMILASAVMGTLSDRGWTKTFLDAWAAAFVGSTITFTCGVLVLSHFVPSENLLVAGVLPFLPGDIFKTLLSSFIAYKTQKSLEIEI